MVTIHRGTPLLFQSMHCGSFLLRTIPHKITSLHLEDTKFSSLLWDFRHRLRGSKQVIPYNFQKTEKHHKYQRRRTRSGTCSQSTRSSIPMPMLFSTSPRDTGRCMHAFMLASIFYGSPRLNVCVCACECKNLPSQTKTTTTTTTARYCRTTAAAASSKSRLQ